MTDAASRLLDTLRPVVADERVLAAIAAVPARALRPRTRSARWRTTTRRCRSATARRSPSRSSSRGCSSCSHSTATERVLDVGTGSGYHAALLALLAAEVFSIERHAGAERVRAARARAARGRQRAAVRRRRLRGLPGACAVRRDQRRRGDRTRTCRPPAGQLGAGGRLRCARSASTISGSCVMRRAVDRV